MSEIWTPEVTELFLALVNNPANLGYTEIARRLSFRFDCTFTKNACIGKARRLGVPPRPRREPRPQISRSRLRAINNGISIEKLGRNNCRFILSPFESQPPYQYCGRRVAVDGTSWCSHHRKKVFTKRHAA